jgi:hypothetical protein
MAMLELAKKITKATINIAFGLLRTSQKELKNYFDSWTKDTL